VYVAFAWLDTAIVVLRYPFDLGYAAIRWWLVELEIIVVVLMATVIATSLGYTASRLLPRSTHRGAVTALLAAVLLLSGGQTARFYWNGQKDLRDWNLSWNDEMYLATRWLAANAPRDAVVGSWNAGVVGYYAEQRVVNLDGLINNFDLLPYLVDRRTSEYILDNGITYLADMDPSIRSSGARDGLATRLVYGNYSEFFENWYQIYRVDERR
jgi:hypothetical protein